MIDPREPINVFKHGGTVYIVYDNQLYVRKIKRRKSDLETGDTILHPDIPAIYKLTKEDGRLIGRTPNGNYLGMLSFQEQKVSVFEKVSEVDTTTTLECEMCSMSFSFDNNGAKYKEEAHKHIKDMHCTRGKVNDKVIEKLLTQC